MQPSLSGKSLMAHPSSPLDIRMPLLAFVGLMLEHGMPVSEKNWEKIEAIEAGAPLDQEIVRAVDWLNAQGKSHAVAPLVRQVCQNQELVESPTHWVQLVGMPVIGKSQHMESFAKQWATQEMGNLAESARLPFDAKWAWLPGTFDPSEVNAWLSSPRHWLAQAVLGGHSPEQMADAMHLLSQGLHTEIHSHDDTPTVRLMVGCLVSKDKSWLDQEETEARGLLHLGVDLHALADNIAQELHANGLVADEESIENQFLGRYGQPLDDLARQTAEAIDQEMAVLDLMGANTGISGVELEPIYPLADALANCARLQLRLALTVEMNKRQDVGPNLFSQAHVCEGETCGSAWAVGMAENGEVCGPYHLDGVTLWKDQIPRLVREVFESNDSCLDEMEMVFHDHPGDLPRGRHRLH